MTQTNNHTIKSILKIATILFLVLAANWFFTFQLVCLKDDNSFYYMPVRMYLSDALHARTLPFWNPFLLNGVPQISDMQGAVWNPFAFFFCYFFKYNHTLFLIEYLIYISFAAIGAYKLFSLITNKFSILFIGTTIYIACGFVSGIANFINWTASLAFIPWIFYYFFSIIQQPTFLKAIALGIFCWLMLVCGYPAFIIYTAYCLLVLTIFFVYKHIKQNEGALIFEKLLFLVFSLSIGVVLSLPALIAYVEFLPFYSRGKELATDFAFRDCFYPQFLSSLFIPASVYNKKYDLLCHSANRDIYFGVLPVCILFLFIAKPKQLKKSLLLVLSAIAVFTFIFLFGYLTPLGNFCFNYVPLMGSFKWSAAARIFLLLLFIAAIVYYLNTNQYTITAKQKKGIQVLGIFMLVGIVFVFFITNRNAVFDSPTHQQIFYANTILQIILWLIVFAKNNLLFRKQKFLVAFIVVDLLLNYFIGMAITGVGNVKPQVFNNYATEFYKQEPNNYLKHPLAINRSLYMFNPWTNHNASKIMNGATFLMSNTLFTGYEKMFIQDTSNERILRNHAFVFSEDIDLLKIDSIDLKYNQINIQVQANTAGSIIVQQNNYYRWSEKNNTPINTWKDCFMQIPVKAGVNTIQLQYNTGNYVQLMIGSYLLFIILLLILFFSSRNKILSTNRQP